MSQAVQEDDFGCLAFDVFLMVSPFKLPIIEWERTTAKYRCELLNDTSSNGNPTKMTQADAVTRRNGTA